MKVLGLLTLVGVVGLSTMTSVAGDWAVWRGEKGDGISSETTWNPRAIKKLKIKWEAQLGKGYSAVSVVSGRVYTMGNTGKVDVVHCLDEKTGKTVWTFDYPCKQGNYKGPRATPAIVGGKVYTLSREGRAYCLDAAFGKEIWKKDLIAMGAKNITWGISSTPLLVKGVVYYNAGESGIALNATSGVKVWASKGKGGYAVPTVL